MSFARWRTLICESANDNSPTWLIAWWYGFLAASASGGALAMLRVAPGMIQLATGRPVSISGFSPPVWLLCVVLMLGGLIGAACGLLVGRFVNAAASDNPRLAIPLLFVVLFVPPACMLAGWTWALIAVNDGVGKSLAYLGVLLFGDAVTCYSFHRDGWPENIPRG